MTRPILVCFPHAGATSAVYRHWDSTAAGVRMAYLDRPGRGRGPRMRRGTTDLAEVTAASAAAVVQRVSGRESWIAFGHSFGAAMAAVVASEVMVQGGPAPDLVVLSCGGAPADQDPRDGVADLDDDQLNEHLLALGETTRTLLDGPLGGIVRRYFRQDQALRAQLAQGRVPIRLSCPVLTVAARGDEFVPAEHVRAWHEHTTGPARHLDVEGDHFAVVHDPAPVLASVHDLLDGAVA